MKTYNQHVSESKKVKLTCLYIHGLGAKVDNKIKEALSDYKVLYPEIDYNGTTEPYYKCLDILEKYKVDFIIGHSIGGVMAYWLAKEKNVPALLLCPAFGDDYKVYVSKSVKRNTPKMKAVIGTLDEEVSSKEVEKVLDRQPNCEIVKFKTDHDISKSNLESFTKQFVKDNI